MEEENDNISRIRKVLFLTGKSECTVYRLTRGRHIIRKQCFVYNSNDEVWENTENVETTMHWTFSFLEKLANVMIYLLISQMGKNRACNEIE